MDFKDLREINLSNNKITSINMLNKFFQLKKIDASSNLI
jgi:Leucine-rich repeat (LRR) protein